MSTVNVNNSALIGGVSIGGTATRTGTGQVTVDTTLAAALAGTLSTRTDDDTGVLTVAGGHGLVPSISAAPASVVNVFWSGGLRYGMTVTATSDTTVTVDGGSGDNFPVVNTVITVAEQEVIDIADFDGDGVDVIAVLLAKRGHIDFQTSGDASIKAQELTADEMWIWIVDQGFTNPLAGETVAQLIVSCGEASTAALKVGVLHGTE